jgi:hypothetical protein
MIAATRIKKNRKKQNGQKKSISTLISNESIENSHLYHGGREPVER